MEIVYTSIMEDITDANLKATLANRTIKYIELTRSEFNSLVAEQARMGMYSGSEVRRMDKYGFVGVFDGVKLKVMSVK